MPKEKQPPRDISNLEFNGINYDKQCYCYSLDLPSDQGLSRVEGIFIRSAESEDRVYELDIEVPEKVEEVDVSIYPFKLGKSTYEIYTYNSEGFTKCSERIVLYNELQVPGHDESLFTDYLVAMVGRSEGGLLIDKKSTNGEIIPMVHNGLVYRASSISIGNGLILCDKRGDVAGWGEMYSPDDEANSKETKPEEDELER